MISFYANVFNELINLEWLIYLNDNILINVYMSNMSPITEANLSINKLRHDNESIRGEFICTAANGAGTYNHSSWMRIYIKSYDTMASLLFISIIKYPY